MDITIIVVTTIITGLIACVFYKLGIDKGFKTVEEVYKRGETNG